MKKVIISSILFWVVSFAGHSQSKIEQLEDSIVYNSFTGGSIDQLYWNGNTYTCSYSPLIDFEEYRWLYASFFLICEGSYGNTSKDKDYMVDWIIVNDCLYLCDMLITCDDDTQPPLKYYYKVPAKGVNSEYMFLVKMAPLAELTGRKFHKKFPAGIFPRPLGSGYAIAADWFNGVIEVKNDLTSYFASYQRLVFKAGRIVSIQNINYCYYQWDTTKQSNVMKISTLNLGPRVVR